MAQEPRGGRLPLGRETRVHAVRRAVESGWPRKKSCGHCRVSRPTPCRWVRRYDGTAESLLPQSHRPKPGHPAKKGPGLARKAVAPRRRNPGDPAVDVRARCRMAGLSMRCRTCLRILRREGFTEPYRTTPRGSTAGPARPRPAPGTSGGRA